VPVDTKTEKQNKCDKRLAGIFGGPDTVMATKFTLGGLRPLYDKVNGKLVITNTVRNTPVDKEELQGKEIVENSEDPRAGVVHLYSNADGTAISERNAFTPDGYEKVSSGDKGISSTGNFIRFYYKPGSLAKFGYDGGLIVNFTHIEPTNKASIPLEPDTNAPRNAAGSISVGILGAIGSDPNKTKGSNNGYDVHSHMVFNTWDGKSKGVSKSTRIDPKSVFCKDLGF
jgi:hypothetical protein